MTQKGAIYFAGYGDQQGTVEVSQIWSGGGPDFPVLNIRLDISLRPVIERSQQQPVIQPITLLRAVGEFRSPEQRVVARFHSDIVLKASNLTYLSTSQEILEIPLDLVTISRIEKERAGGNLRVELRLRLVFALHVGNTLLEAGFYSGRVDGLTFTIPRSQWVDELLPGLGYGGLEILEVRYGIGIFARVLPQSVAEIQEGKKCLSEGQWEKATLHCRKAIEFILDSKPSSLPATVKFSHRLDTFITDNLPSVDDAEAKLIAGQMQLIWEITSPAAHAAPAHAFIRADAEFILRITMAVVEYFSRLLS
jgi:hypothetical protein